jgi:hypothetical protein
MKDIVGIRIKDTRLRKMLEDHAEREFSTPAAIGRKCIALALPLLVAGVPTAALEAMAGGKVKR